ncbi:DUF3040 domain-containing protein [Actinoplanes utahensis]|uniref:DUF3040 domain-containing protein n=1 Tax=Actinoplanes utahensis TaxID=1869 RepID=UPI0007C8493D|nr:DUF3040 domain-containing protein [Actinoplanes utahensis]GIF30049.1 hypothetical protein Aut01nite_30350 [Actinoplanes utahensis]
MLSDDDRRVLADLESRVHLSDPEFAARMADRCGPARFPALAVLCAALFILVPPVMLLFSWAGLIVVLDLFLVAVAVVLIRRHRHPSRRTPHSGS